MSWEKEFEHMRDYGHTWGPGIDDYVEPTEEEYLEHEAMMKAYEKELDVLRVPGREKYVKAGEKLKEGLPSSHDITFGTAPFHWREDYSTEKIKLCKEASEELGYVFERRRWPMEQKDEFMISVERYGFLPGEDGNIHRYAVTGIKDPMKCLQLVADFEAIGCAPTTYWLEKKDTRFDTFLFIGESDTGRLYKNMERWGVSFDKKEMLSREIKCLASALDQFVFDLDPYEYRDAVDNREEALLELQKNISKGEVKHIKDWHKDISIDTYDREIVLESKTLMKWLEKVEKKVQKELNATIELKEKISVDQKIAGAKKELSEKDNNQKTNSKTPERSISDLPFL